MKYDWKLPTVWASQHRPWVFFLLFFTLTVSAGIEIFQPGGKHMSAMYQTFQNTPIFQTAWRGFLGSKWTDEVNVRDFIQNNYTQYDGDESFLAAPTSATHLLWERLQKLQKEEHEKGGVLECETEIVSSLTAYGPGYIDPELKDLERIVGLQTDKPLKRAFMPFGGIKMAEEAAETYGYHVNPKFHKIFTEYHKTHNQAVFDAYTPEMKTARHCHIVTGLPDTYGRGRIVGDYRRIALYGIDFLIQEKKKDLERCGNGAMFDDIIRQREEISEQIRALKGPVTGLGLVERLDRVNVCAKAFEVLDVLGHVLSEFLRVCKIIATGVASTSGVTAVGQEPRSGVGEGLYVGDVRVIAGGTALNPPVLGGGLGEVILVVVSRVECRSQLVFVGLLGGYAIAIRAGAGGVIFPRARHGSALAHEWVAVGNIGGIAAAHVVAGHVQVQSFITEDGLVELFAQLFAVFHSLSLGSIIAEIGGDGRFLAEAAGGVGEPSQRGAPAIETVGIPRVRGHGNGIVISRIRSAGNRKRPSSH